MSSGAARKRIASTRRASSRQPAMCSRFASHSNEAWSASSATSRSVAARTRSWSPARIARSAKVTSTALASARAPDSASRSARPNQPGT